ncbi:MAG: chaperone modulator CbpM [Bacteroidota bacterium]|nr:chaperone modulator CbpM [Bacteroidota bacterium]
METEHRIRVDLICTHYNVEIAFIESLQDYGLLEIHHQADNRYLDSLCLQDLERMIRLHFDLGVNMEGIDTITHLLKRMQYLQEEVQQLRNRLHGQPD